MDEHPSKRSRREAEPSGDLMAFAVIALWLLWARTLELYAARALNLLLAETTDAPAAPAASFTPPCTPPPTPPPQTYTPPGTPPRTPTDEADEADNDDRDERTHDRAED